MSVIDPTCGLVPYSGQVYTQTKDYDRRLSKVVPFLMISTLTSGNKLTKNVVILDQYPSSYLELSEAILFVTFMIIKNKLEYICKRRPC